MGYRLVITSMQTMPYRKAKIMLYSKDLVARFQKQYQESYGLEITAEVAEMELQRLARLLEVFYLSVFTREENQNDFDK